MDENGTEKMIIDCDRCAVRGAACTDCVVTVLFATEIPVHPVELDSDEARALAALADGGLLPPLRLTPRAEAG